MNTPDTLPADFNFNSTPDSLPADFNFDTPAPPKPQQDNSPGFFQSIIQSIAKPVLKVGSSLSQVEGGAILSGANLVSNAQKLLGFSDASLKTDQFSGKLADAMKTGAEQGTDYGYFGKVKPIGTAVLNDAYSGTEKVVRAALDTAGTAGEIGSWAVGIPEAKATGFFAKAFETFKAIQPMAAAFGASAATESAGEGKSAKDSAIEGFTNYAGTVIGNQLIHGVAQAGTGLARIGMKSAVGQALADKATQFADHLYQMFPERFQDLYKKGSDFLSQKYGSAMDAKYAVAEKDFNQWHNETIKDYASSAQKPVDPNAIYNQVQTEAAQGKSALQNEVRAKYNTVIDSGAQIPNKPVAKVLDTVQRDVERASLPGNAPAEGKMSAADFKANGGKFTEPSNPHETTQAYIDKIRSVISDPKGSSDIQLMYSLAQHAPGVAKGSPEEALITQLRTSLYDSIEQGLKKNNPDLMKQWLGARKMSEFVGNKIDTRTTELLSFDARSPETFAEKFFEGKSNPDDLQNTFGLLSPKNQETMRQYLINQMFEMGKISNDKGHAAGIIGDMLDKYKGTSILKPEDVTALSDFQNLLKKDLGGFMDGMQHVIDPEKFAQGIGQQQTLAFTKKFSDLAKAGNYSQIATEVSKIKSVEEMKAVTSLLNPEQKDVLATHVLVNKIQNNISALNTEVDGKLNLTGYMKEIESIGGENSKEIYSTLFNEKQQQSVNSMLELLRQQKDITNVSKTSALSLIHGAASLLNLSLGHLPGALYHGASAARSAVSKGAEQSLGISDKEMFDMLLNDKGKFNTFVRKGLDFMGKQANKAAPYVSAAVGEYLKTVEDMKGSPLTPEETNAAVQQYNQNQ